MQIKLLYHGCFCSNDVHLWTAEASNSEGGKKASLAVVTSFVGMNFYKLVVETSQEKERERENSRCAHPDGHA